MPEEIVENPSAGPSDWFEPLYQQANGNVKQVPWALPGAVPYLTNWLEQNEIKGVDRSAVVVGCGLGDDAEALAAAGFEVTAFDISESAIAWAKKRFPNSAVHYIAADLFDLPEQWIGAFDLVFDFRTIQALPLSVRTEVIQNIAALGKKEGTVLVATYLRKDSEPAGESAPWPLTMAELSEFEKSGLALVKQERFAKGDSRFRDRILIQYCVS
ncbi:MAG: class I SAM-dependent methyltransferase [Cyanobacteria bacterium J06607_10]